MAEEYQGESTSSVKLIIDWGNIETIKLNELTGGEFEYWANMFKIYEKHAIHRLYDSDNNRSIEL